MSFHNKTIACVMMDHRHPVASEGSKTAKLNIGRWSAGTNIDLHNAVDANTFKGSDGPNDKTSFVCSRCKLRLEGSFEISEYSFYCHFASLYLPFLLKSISANDPAPISVVSSYHESTSASSCDLCKGTCYLDAPVYVFSGCSKNGTASCGSSGVYESYLSPIDFYLSQAFLSSPELQLVVSFIYDNLILDNELFKAYASSPSIASITALLKTLYVTIPSNDVIKALLGRIYTSYSSLQLNSQASTFAHCNTQEKFANTSGTPAPCVVRTRSDVTYCFCEPGNSAADDSKAREIVGLDVSPVPNLHEVRYNPNEAPIISVDQLIRWQLICALINKSVLYAIECNNKNNVDNMSRAVVPILFIPRDSANPCVQKHWGQLHMSCSLNTNESAAASSDGSAVRLDYTAVEEISMHCVMEKTGKRSTLSDTTFENTTDIASKNQQRDSEFQSAYEEPKEFSHLGVTLDVILFAGSYRKHSRNMTQTIWVIDGKRKCDISIEEAIGNPLKDALGAESYKFLAAGREDIDVRMLGDGRPFILELYRCRRGPYSLDLPKPLKPHAPQNKTDSALLPDLPCKVEEGILWLESHLPTKSVTACVPYRDCLSARFKTYIKTLSVQLPSSLSLCDQFLDICAKASKGIGSGLRFDEISSAVDDTKPAVEALNMRIISKNNRQMLRKKIQLGAESKAKTYETLVWSSMEIDKEIINRFNVLYSEKRVSGNRDDTERGCEKTTSEGCSSADTENEVDPPKLPIAVYQKTPLRVFHRRTGGTRKRLIQYLSMEWLTSQFFVLRLSTQAGTYIKEFVHGDIGRTSPSLKSLILPIVVQYFCQLSPKPLITISGIPPGMAHNHKIMTDCTQQCPRELMKSYIEERFELDILLLDVINLELN